MKATWLCWVCCVLLTGCATSQAVDPLVSTAGADSARYIVVTLRNPAAPAVPRAGSTVRAYTPPSSYAVSPATRADARAIATAYGLREVSAWPIGLLGVHCLVYELPTSANREELLDRLHRDLRIESAQAFNSFNTLTGGDGPVNDPYRGLQRNLDVMDVSGAHHWSRGKGVRIAIVDTGIDATHPDLAGRVVKQQNFVDSQRSTRDHHGTAVAGVIAAVENNEQGIIGIAPDVQLYGMRACWPETADESRASCSTLTLAKAISAAIESGIDIVNLSLAGPADPLLARLVEVGLVRGVIFVGAIPAGPSGGVSFPSSVAGVIGVDASGGRSSVDSALFAPGNEVLTLVPDGGYDFLSGSSLAAASVSGGIALLLARDGNLRAAEAHDILARSSRSVSTDQGMLASVNLCSALAAVVGEAECKDVAKRSEAAVD
jgi:subtilisin family serine protease